MLSSIHSIPPSTLAAMNSQMLQVFLAHPIYSTLFIIVHYFEALCTTDELFSHAVCIFFLSAEQEVILQSKLNEIVSLQFDSIPDQNIAQQFQSNLKGLMSDATRFALFCTPEVFGFNTTYAFFIARLFTFLH